MFFMSETEYFPLFYLITGYKLSDFKDIVFLFNAILHKEPNENLMTIRNKYSHQ